MRVPFLVSASLVPLVVLAAPAYAALVEIDQVAYDAERGVITVQGGEGIAPRISYLDSPHRMVIDLPGSHFRRNYQQLDGIPGTAIQRIRVGQFQPTITRVVLDLSRAAKFKVVTVGDEVLVALRPDSSLKAAARPAQPVQPVQPAVKPSPVVEAERPEPAEPAAPAEPAFSATLTDIRYSQGDLTFQMSRRMPYYSQVVAGTPNRYVVVFPNVRLSERVDDLKREVNSHGIFGLTARQDGRNARIEVEMSKKPTFFVTPGTSSWTFSNEKPTPAPVARAKDKDDDDDADGQKASRWAKSSDAPLTLRRTGSRWQMAIKADGRFRFKTTRVGDDRVILDLYGAKVALPRDSVYIDNGLIARVRTSGTSAGTRLTVDFDQPVSHAARLVEGDRLLLSLARFNKDQVTVDPGHGGTDHGAIGTKGTREKDVTLAIATRLSRIMEANGMQVQMTRMKDLEILLRPRVDMANRNDSDVFISIHANSFGKFQGVSGIETYYFNDDSYDLAKSVHKQLVSTLKQPDRGVRKNNFYVVHHTKMPAALVEIGYLSNPQEEGLLTSAAYQERAAQAIYAGIKDYLAKKKSQH